MTIVWRRIVHVEILASRGRTGRGSIELTLGCGHKVNKSQNACKGLTIESKIKCSECKGEGDNGRDTKEA